MFHLPLKALFSAAVLFFVACNPTPPSTDTGLIPEQAVPERDTVLVMDQSTPEALLATVADIISTDILDSMRVLCKAGVTSGSPALMMCGIGTEDMSEIDKFRGWFRAPRVDSATIVQGDTAFIPLTLSPGDANLERHAFLKVVRSEDRWYLNDINWKR